MSWELILGKKKVDEMSTVNCESILRGNIWSPWTRLLVLCPPLAPVVIRRLAVCGCDSSKLNMEDLGLGLTVPKECDSSRLWLVEIWLVYCTKIAHLPLQATRHILSPLSCTSTQKSAKWKRRLSNNDCVWSRDKEIIRDVTICEFIKE